jgi:hypothetical protein
MPRSTALIPAPPKLAIGSVLAPSTRSKLHLIEAHS